MMSGASVEDGIVIEIIVASATCSAGRAQAQFPNPVDNHPEIMGCAPPIRNHQISLQGDRAAIIRASEGHSCRNSCKLSV